MVVFNTILKEKNKIEGMGMILPDFKMCYKATVIKRAWY